MSMVIAGSLHYLVSEQSDFFPIVLCHSLHKFDLLLKLLHVHKDAIDHVPQSHTGVPIRIHVEKQTGNLGLERDGGTGGRGEANGREVGR